MEIEKARKLPNAEGGNAKIVEMKSVTVLPVMIGVLGAVSQRFVGYNNKV